MACCKLPAVRHVGVGLRAVRRVGVGAARGAFAAVAQSASAVFACALCYEAVNTTGFVDNTLGSSLTLACGTSRGCTRFVVHSLRRATKC